MLGPPAQRLQLVQHVAQQLRRLLLLALVQQPGLHRLQRQEPLVQRQSLLLHRLPEQLQPLLQRLLTAAGLQRRQPLLLLPGRRLDALVQSVEPLRQPRHRHRHLVHPLPQGVHALILAPLKGLHLARGQPQRPLEHRADHLPPLEC